MESKKQIILATQVPVLHHKIKQIKSQGDERKSLHNHALASPLKYY